MLLLEDANKEEEVKPDQISMSSVSDNSLVQNAVTSESDTPSTPNIEVTVSDNGVNANTISITGSSDTLSSVGKAPKVDSDKRVIDKGMEAPVVRSRSPSPKPSPKKSPSKKGALDSADGGKGALEVA